MRTAFLAWLMIAAALSNCEPREERVTLLRASNLRHEIAPSTHEHLVLLDIVMRKEEWERVEPKDLALEYQNCPKPRHRVPNYYNYGIPHFQGTGDRAIAKVVNAGGAPALKITFKMFNTNVPADVDDVMRDITCVRLRAERGYGRVSYFSDPVQVASKPSGNATR